MSKIKAEEEEKPPSSSDSEDSTNISPSPKSSSRPKNNPQNGKNLINNSGIKEVYKNNFKQEMKNLVSFLNKYNYIGMDTEFPGIVYQVDNYSDDFYYKSIKLNVESLKLIQLGITLSDEKGRLPSPYHTWQFNFEFDPEKDKSSKSSIDLLIKSGIDFNELKQNGIEHKSFFNVIKTSGLVLNPTSEDAPVVGVWIMPNNKLPGMLEDFVATLSEPDDPLMAKADNVLNELEAEKIQRYKVVHRAKAKIHSYLAWQDEPGKPMGVSITAHVLNPDSPSGIKFLVS